MTKKCSILILFLLFQLVIANTITDPKAYHITRTEQAPVIDGYLQDSCWLSAETATDFVQSVPHPDQPASLPTEARVLYDNRNIYVAARMYDNPEKISRQLYRRDNAGRCDLIAVQLDSYNDNRTAFSFYLSAAGTQVDILNYNDEEQDRSWNAVWEGKVQIDSLGWTAEFKIPLSQIRYNANSPDDSWGLQFYRYTSRFEEFDFWSCLPENSVKVVSTFGTCTGTGDIGAVPRIEIQPYFSAAYHSDAINTPVSINAGADLKMGIGSNFTLTATTNPDFGQVEADPASVNLSANELYLNEQRPFFMEGLDILNFGSTKTYYSDLPAMIYTRRIGRSPTGHLPEDISSITHLPTETTILSALKISGKTKNGLSIAAFDALTQEESVKYVNNSGTDTSCVIEPLANSFIGKVRKDFNEGQSMAGLFLSSVNRNLTTDMIMAEYHHSAAIAGIDFEHRLKNQSDWIISGLTAFSHITGSQESITAVQTASQRYYQRPDANYITLDSSRTSLDGLAWQSSITKNEGKHLSGSLTWSGATPGFEINDIGFQTRADYQSISAVLNYVENSQGQLFRGWNSNIVTSSAWNFGGQRVWTFTQLEFLGKFKNYSYIYGNFCMNYGSMDDGLTRGGPVTRYLPQHSYYVSGGSDSRKKISINSTFTYRKGVSGYSNLYGAINMTYCPLQTLNLVFTSNFTNHYNPTQYVRTVEDDLAVSTYGARYVFSNVSGRQASSSCRIEWIATPDLTFQLYMRPYITSYDYGSYYELDHPGDIDMNLYGSDLGTVTEDSDGNYIIDPDGSDPAASFTINNPDFNYHALQTTGVIRWEFKSACILYLVWQQDRRTYLSGNEAAAQLHYFRDYTGLFREHAGNNFQLKLVYWLGM